MPPPIHTYHCICTSLLLASTHNLSHLPRRSKECSLDSAIILPLPSTPPPQETTTLSSAGYTLLLGLTPAQSTAVVRKHDGFERRRIFRCGRCGVVVGYEIVADADGDAEISGGQEEEEGGVYRGWILYILPGGVRTTEGMVEGTRVGEGDVEIHGRSVAVLGEV